MNKRIIELSQPSSLRVHHRQLKIKQEGAIKDRIPFEDIEVILCSHPGITLTQCVVQQCLNQGIALIHCDERYMPVGQTVPLTGHHYSNRVLMDQVKVKSGVCKRLWQQVITQKIYRQAEVLAHAGLSSARLEAFAERVKKGDQDNMEAHSALIYWSSLFGHQFKRNPDESGINGCLNYGYALLRSVITRSIVASGCHPVWGIHHRNHHNAFCLADDLMEPLRPWVDWLVWRHNLPRDDTGKLSVADKSCLLNILTAQVSIQERPMPLSSALSHYLAQYKRCIREQSSHLYFPKLDLGSL